jgi:hypothetical protein
MNDSNETNVPPGPIKIAIVGWLLPGAGYFMIGQSWRGMFAGVSIVLIFVMGLLIGGVRVVDVPGYDVDGERVLKLRPITNVPGVAVRAVMEKPWYIPQFLAGPLNLATSWASVSAARGGVEKSTARVFDIGQLYTAVAGMLNLFIMIDAAHRAIRIREENPQLGPM